MTKAETNTLRETANYPDPSIDDEAWLRKALKRADPNVLRVTLYQHTRDPELKGMDAQLTSAPGNPYEIYAVADEDRHKIIEKGVAYFLDAERPERMNLTAVEVRELIDMFEGQAVSDSAAKAGYEELAFGGFKREAQWPAGHRPEVPEDFQVLIVGAGFSAIVAAMQLDSLGIDYRIVERQEEFGGTWCLNTYPDARVDITTFIYNFTFEMNYPWRHAFAPREELNEYTEYLVEKYHIRERAQFSTKVVDAAWDEASAKWQVELEGPDGVREALEANIVLSAAGLFSTPKLPDIEGIERFQGKMFHTTEWDHDYDYRGKRVALIGTGSTGSQLLPKVAPDVAHMTVYQRTPNWITPVPSYRAEIAEERRWLLANLPGYANWNRYSFVDASVRAQCFQDLDHEWRAQGGQINEKNDLLRSMLVNMIETKMADKPELIPHLIPDFAPLSRRIVVDNGFYDTLLRDNVNLHVDGISHITERGIVGRDGVEEEFDLIILAAGFEVERYLYPVAYKGRNGATLDDLWSIDGARAYLTMTMPGFPNFFMMYGPNAGVRAGSFHSSVEMLSRYICETIAAMLDRGATSVEIREDVFKAYNQRMDEGMKEKLWEEEKGGNSYYLNRHGKSGVNMPWTLFEFYDFIRKPDVREFNFT